MIPKIKSVKPLKHYILHVIFEYGEEIKLCPPETGKYQGGIGGAGTLYEIQNPKPEILINPNRNFIIKSILVRFFLFLQIIYHNS